ncbi:PREDICTED: zinc finger and BTB domain-containing protein 24 [Drosophila arizonae]|uniref:Zinc finger and BTB domain-containing protein 24 n=1 Tax=Drosophila arizonae TaxID=7263 RepID=A0ABM1P7V3_DROAR|nr:PREDICTED: zinc finger and BTB domain-containing protein 24 [Drosophila arizonae]
MSSKHTPDISELLPVREYRCEHCTDQVFGNQSHYSLHLRRRHKLALIKNDATNRAYHCPVANCIYHEERKGGRGFTNLRFLRQHYQKTHMTKTFKCNNCNEAFLLERHLEKHQCCSTYPCPICGLTYTSKASLQTHMRRKNHLSVTCESDITKNVAELSKVAIPKLKPCKNLPKSTIKMVDQSTNTEEAPSDDPPNNVSNMEHIPTVDSPMQPSFYCLPDVEVPYALQTSTQTEDSVDMDVAIQTAIDVALKERENAENGLPMPSLTYDEVNRLLRDMETQTEDVDLDELDMNNEVLGPLLRDIQTQTLDNRQHQGTMTELDQDTETQPNDNYAAYQEEQETMFGPQNSAHMHTQTCDELFEELGLSHIQTQTHWPDGLYNTQHTQTCDEMLDELLENFQSTYTQTRW